MAWRRARLCDGLEVGGPSATDLRLGTWHVHVVRAVECPAEFVEEKNRSCARSARELRAATSFSARAVLRQRKFDLGPQRTSRRTGSFLSTPRLPLTYRLPLRTQAPLAATARIDKVRKCQVHLPELAYQRLRYVPTVFHVLWPPC